ncbi:MAG: DinB family protein [Armatimonadetes bacterium]|nr:DinB family protein [Armatimonadota bacterium]
MQHLMAVLDRQVDVTRKLISLVPEGKENYAPAPGFMPLGALLRHLGESLGFLKMVVTDGFPSQKDVLEAQTRPPQSATPSEAIQAIEKNYKEFRELSEKMTPDFYNKGIVKTPFMGDAPCWLVLAGGAEHLINHKHQLFIYLKLMGMPVDTGTLYSGVMIEKSKA